MIYTTGIIACLIIWLKYILTEHKLWNQNGMEWDIWDWVGAIFVSCLVCALSWVGFIGMVFSIKSFTGLYWDED